MTKQERNKTGQPHIIKTRGRDVTTRFLRSAHNQPLEALLVELQEDEERALRQRPRVKGRIERDDGLEDSDRGWRDDGAGIFNTEHYVAYGTATLGRSIHLEDERGYLCD